MRHKISVIGFCIINFLVLIFCSELLLAGDYNLAYWQLQRRTYEDGSYVNRVAFQINDTSGTPVLTDVIKSITLVGPGGAVALPPYDFFISDLLIGNFDFTTSQWSYESNFTTTDTYRMHFGGVLLPGQYTLTVIDKDDVTVYTGSKVFNGLVDLPQISSDSFRGFEDSSGNLIWGWEPPSDTNFWNNNSATSVRARVEILNGNNYVGEVYVRFSTASGSMFVPADVMALAKAKGDTLSVVVNLQTNDDNNRCYSKTVPLSSLKPTGNGGSFFVVPIKAK